MVTVLTIYNLFSIHAIRKVYFTMTTLKITRGIQLLENVFNRQHLIW